MRALIVDDEDLARAIVREYLAAYPGVELVGECSNGFDAVKAIADLKPDLLFLDIQMPKLNGFEVLDLLDVKPRVIFVTAFESYAIKAFEVNALDYLLKPFSRERFEQAMRRVTGDVPQGSADDMAKLVSTVRSLTRPIERILVRDGNSVHVIPAAVIDHIEAQDDYVTIYSGGKKFLKLERISELEAALDPKLFVRIHRSHIVNIERLARLETYAKESRIVVLRDGTKLPVSRSGYEKLKGLL
ncbi:MAG TPA: LytTR family DNA-binding domain-containing protein [Bacteroidota bacterium]|nr:LytTR family DNA-binding domain-containing protein [Bacteroidota bacterium]